MATQRFNSTFKFVFFSGKKENIEVKPEPSSSLEQKRVKPFKRAGVPNS